MIPILYDESEVWFNRAGIGRIVDCISCRVTEERNGIYECEFQYPVNGQMFKEIKPGRIIYVSHDVSGDMQPFDIYAYRIDLDGVATYYARHVCYRLNYVVIDYKKIANIVEATPSTWNFVLNQVNGCWLNKPPHTERFSLNITGFDNAGVKIKPTVDRVGSLYTARDFLMGETNSIVSVLDGELLWNMFRVGYSPRRGSDTTAVIRAGLNLNSMTYEYDESDKVDAIAPYYTKASTAETYTERMDAVVYLNGENEMTDSSGNTVVNTDAIAAPEMYVKGAQCRLAPVDLTSEFFQEPNQGDLFVKASTKFNNLSFANARENLTIEFEQLWEASEYEYIAPADKLKLCDTAIIVVPEIGLAKRMKVVKVVWDALMERYVSMEFGTLENTIYGVGGVRGTPDEEEQGIVDIPPDTPVTES